MQEYEVEISVLFLLYRWKQPENLERYLRMDT